MHQRGIKSLDFIYLCCNFLTAFILCIMVSSWAAAEAALTPLELFNDPLFHIYRAVSCSFALQLFIRSVNKRQRHILCLKYPDASLKKVQKLSGTLDTYNPRLGFIRGGTTNVFENFCKCTSAQMAACEVKQETNRGRQRQG